MRKYKVYLVSSSNVQDRNSQATEAKNLYQSPMFRACKTFVETENSNWLILSDLHGVVWPDVMLAPYEIDCLSDEERTERIVRSFSPDEMANTLICLLGLQPTREVTASEWKRSILSNTTFVLLGDSDSLSVAMSELTLLGATVDFKGKGIII